MSPGCSWNPSLVRVDEEAYAELRDETPPERRADSCGATTVEEWTAWYYRLDHGVDYERHLEHLKRMRAADVAREASHTPEAEETYLRARLDYSHFMMDAMPSRDR